MLRRHAFSAVGVVILHIVVLVMLVQGIRTGETRSNRELQVTVFAPHLTSGMLPPPPLSWKLQMPPDIEVPEPQIDIIPDSSDPHPIIFSLMNQEVPPRLDPDHANTLPDVPYDLKKAAAVAVIMLRLLILPDGSVEQVEVVKGSSVPDLDKVTVDYVQKNWKFLPGSMGGKPIEAWTTAFVRFATPNWSASR